MSPPDSPQSWRGPQAREPALAGLSPEGEYMAVGNLRVTERPIAQPAPVAVRTNWSDPLDQLRTRDWVLLACIVALGAVGRMQAVLVDFPFNDGGLFHAMTLQVLQNDFALPVSLRFNVFDVPFAYPPLGFYLTATVSTVTGLPVETVMRLLPAVISTTTVLAVFRLARSFGFTRLAVFVATFAFAVVPRGFAWTLMGGGITRAPGYLFALLATAQLLDLARTRSRRDLAFSIVLCALTVLSHPEATLVLLVSGALLFLRHRRSLTTLLEFAAVAVGVLLVTAPWWGLVVARHGLMPFTDAGSTSIAGNFQRLLLLPLVSGNAPLALVGAYVCLRKRHAALPAWMLLVLVVTGEFRTYVAAPLALLAGVGVAALPWQSFLVQPRQRLIAILLACVVLAGSLYGMSYFPLGLIVAELGAIGASVSRKVLGQTGEFRSYMVAPLTVLGATILLVWGRSRLTPSLQAASAVLACLVIATAVYGMLRFPFGPVLQQEDRSAISWVTANTEPDARFVVMSGTPYWGVDPASEWFGALSGRTSLATPQGSEWLGQRSHMDGLYGALQACATGQAGCLDDWSRQHDAPFDYVFIPSTPAHEQTAPRCCAPLESSLRASPAYVVAYDAHDAVVFRRAR